MSFPSVPSVEEVRKWSPKDVITFLEAKKEELFLDDKHIKVIEDQEVAGRAFLELTADKLMRIGLTLGPAESIGKLIRDINGEQEGTSPP